MKSKKPKYFLMYYGTSGDGYIGYDGEPTHNIDNCEFYDSEVEAEAARMELQKVWQSPIVVGGIEG